MMTDELNKQIMLAYLQVESDLLEAYDLARVITLAAIADKQPSDDAPISGAASILSMKIKSVRDELMDLFEQAREVKRRDDATPCQG